MKKNLLMMKVKYPASDKGMAALRGSGSSLSGKFRGVPYCPFQPQDSMILLNLTSSLLAILTALENTGRELEPSCFLGVRKGSPHRDHEPSSCFLRLWQG